VLQAALTLALASGCMSSPMLDYSLNVPAQTLIPPGAPPVQEGRARFREIFCALLAQEPGAATRPCDALLHRLSDEPARARRARPLPSHAPGWAVIFVPGLLGECAYGLAPPFESSVPRLRRLGYDARIAPVNASAPSHANAERLAQEINESPAERIVLVGHARGAVDILELLAAHPAAASRVQAVLSVAGAINGSPLADTPSGASLLLPRGGERACTEGEREALSDLKRAHRLRWLMEHPLPQPPRYFSIGAFAPRAEVSKPLRARVAALATIDPRNDGLTPFFDQMIPGAELLGYANADHWSVVTDTQGQSSASGTSQDEAPPFRQEVLIEAALLRIVEALSSNGAGG
jgi:pimeloyl-ACP methyl ester carboxylesterase